MNANNENATPTSLKNLRNACRVAAWLADFAAGDGKYPERENVRRAIRVFAKWTRADFRQLWRSDPGLAQWAEACAASMAA